MLLCVCSQGTVILHVNSAVKHDPTLARELLAMFAKSAEPLSVFRCGVLLAVARIPRYETPVLDILRKRVTRQCKV